VVRIIEAPVGRDREGGDSNASNSAENSSDSSSSGLLGKAEELKENSDDEGAEVVPADAEKVFAPTYFLYS
jgi:hypothetical protein